MFSLKQPWFVRAMFIFYFRRVNRLEPARLLRNLFPRPSFIPNTVNMERFILIDEPKAPQYKLVCFEIMKSVLATLFFFLFFLTALQTLIGIR